MSEKTWQEIVEEKNDRIRELAARHSAMSSMRDAQEIHKIAAQEKVSELLRVNRTLLDLIDRLKAEGKEEVRVSLRNVRNRKNKIQDALDRANHRLVIKDESAEEPEKSVEEDKEAERIRVFGRKLECECDNASFFVYAEKKALIYVTCSKCGMRMWADEIVTIEKKEQEYYT